MENVMLNINKTLAFTKENNISKNSNGTKDFASTLESVNKTNKEDISKISDNKSTELKKEVKTKAESENEDLSTEEIEEIESKTKLSEMEIAMLNIPVKLPVENIESMENMEELQILNLENNIEPIAGLNTDVSLENLDEIQETELSTFEELISNDIDLDDEVETEIKALIEKSTQEILSKNEIVLDKQAVVSNSFEVKVDTEDMQLDESQTIIEDNKAIMNLGVEASTKKTFSENQETGSEESSDNNFNGTLTADVFNSSQINKVSTNEFQSVNKSEQLIEAKEVINQIVKSVKINVSDLKNEIKLDLKPEALGKLAMTIEVIKGEVTAKIMVDNHRTKEIIEANLAQLKEGTKESNIEIKTVEVYVGNNSDFDKHSSGNFNSNQPNKRIKIKPQNSKIANNYDEQTIDKKTNDYGTYNENGLNLFA